MRATSRLAEWILGGAVPQDDRQYVFGDLAEEYADRRRHASRLSAQWWYWTQVLRSIPWLLWIPVRRSGSVATSSIALVACSVQAIIELTTASLLPRITRMDALLFAPFSLLIVLTSLVLVSWIANRVRPGAGTLLALIAGVSVLTRALHAGIVTIHLSSVLEGVAAPAAAFVGAALAVNRGRSHEPSQ